MAMEKVSIDKAKLLAKNKGLKPGRVRTTKNAVQFTKGGNLNVQPISWEEFEKFLKERKLAIYNWNGWLKIMKE